MRAHHQVDRKIQPREIFAAALAGLLLLALTFAPALAQAQPTEAREAENQKEAENQEEAQKAEEEEEETDFLERRIGDNWILSPIIFPIYSPETELALAIGGVATFST